MSDLQEGEIKLIYDGQEHVYVHQDRVGQLETENEKLKSLADTRILDVIVAAPFIIFAFFLLLSS